MELQISLMGTVPFGSSCQLATIDFESLRGLTLLF
jgi:hypothetical protein